MEHNDTQIPFIIEKLIVLLRKNNEESWAAVFEKILHEYISNSNKSYAARDIIHIFQGGMGSFNDLVLQKDSKMLIEENNELDKLKRDLFNSCRDFI